jgi:hypothetical protein
MNKEFKGTNIYGTKEYESNLVENQFRFHQDIFMLYWNLHRIEPNSLISITYKLHGISGISSYVLCKDPITKFDKDIWEIANDEIAPYLPKGFSAYYEIVGFLPNGESIQKDYDYGCKSYSNNGNTIGEHAIYIYRITSTNIDGKTIELSAKQVQDFCKTNGLNAVPELYYGYAKDCFPNIYHLIEEPDEFSDQKWNEEFLIEIKKKYNEKDCYMCSTKVLEEGCVIRIEGNDFEAYKAKSARFYTGEATQLNKEEIDIES